MCHELRNPLHVLETWLAHNGSVVFNADLDIQRDVQGAMQQMRRTVDDVLDFRRVTEGGFLNDPVPVNVQQVTHASFL